MFSQLSQWRSGAQLVGLQSQHDWYKVDSFSVAAGTEGAAFGGSSRKSGRSRGGGNGVPFVSYGGMLVAPDDHNALIAGATSAFAPDSDESSVVVAHATLSNSARSSLWGFNPSLLGAKALQGESSCVGSVAWGPQGGVLVGGNKAVVSLYDQHTVVSNGNAEAEETKEAAPVSGRNSFKNSSSSKASGGGRGAAPVAALHCGSAKRPLQEVSSIKAAPGDPTPNSILHCLAYSHSSTNSHLVLAGKEHGAYLWDLGNGSKSNYFPTNAFRCGHQVSVSAVCWAPAVGGTSSGAGSEAAQASPFLFLAGTSDGTTRLFDLRVGHSPQVASYSAGRVNSQQGTGRTHRRTHGTYITDLQFNPTHHCVFSVSDLAGGILLYDVRVVSSSGGGSSDANGGSGALEAGELKGVELPESLHSTSQFGVSSHTWLPFHSDTLVSGGSDGTVKFFNLRQAPGFCVGKQQFNGPVKSLHVTKTRQRQCVLALTASGEVACVEPAMRCFYNSAPKPEPFGTETANSSAALDHEQKAVQYLYARQPGKGKEKLLAAILERLGRKESKRAAELLQFLQSAEGVPFSKPEGAPVVPGEELLSLGATRGGRFPGSFGNSFGITSASTMSGGMRRGVATPFATFLRNPFAQSCMPPSMAAPPQGPVIDLPGHEAHPLIQQRLQAVRVNVVVGSLIDSRDCDTLALRCPLLLDLLKTGVSNSLNDIRGGSSGPGAGRGSQRQENTTTSSSGEGSGSGSTVSSSLLIESIPLILSGVDLLLQERPTQGMEFLQSLVREVMLLAQDVADVYEESLDNLKEGQAEDEEDYNAYGRDEEETQEHEALKQAVQIGAEVLHSLQSLLLQLMGPTVVTLVPPPKPGATKSGGTQGKVQKLSPAAKQIAADFFSDPAYVNSVLKFELRLNRVLLTSSDCSKPILAIGKEFEREHQGTGMVRMVSLSPLLLYLNTLIGARNYVPFFWICARWYQRHEGTHPAAQQVLQLFEAELHGLCQTLADMTGQLRSLVNSGSTHSVTVDGTVRCLKKLHPFVLAVCRTVVETEQASNKYEGNEAPPLIEAALDTLEGEMTNSLEVWSMALSLNVTTRYSASALRDPVVNFKREVQTAMRELNAIDDPTMSEIVTQCQQFVSPGR